jgi:hypothetical protein
MEKPKPWIQTKRLLEVMQATPGKEFRAAELKRLSGVPKSVVRRRLTVDGTNALDPIPGVGMTQKRPFVFWWKGESTLGGPADAD